MQEFKVIPLNSIGPIELGMFRDEVHRIFEEPSSVEDAHEKWGIQWPGRVFFFNNGFQVTYDAELKAVHIEAVAESAYTVTLDGIRVHEAEPQDVVEAIRKHGEVDTQTRCIPSTSLALNLYREHSEEDKFDTIGIGVPKPRPDES